jgi:hypothetical protein
VNIINNLLMQLNSFIAQYGNEGVFALGLGIVVALGGCSMGRKR